MKNFEKLYRELSNMTTSSNIPCRDFTKLLECFGFEITSCGAAGHRIAKHPAVTLAEYPDFDCGHDQGTPVKRPYIKKLFKFVELHKESIKEYSK